MSDLRPVEPRPDLGPEVLPEADPGHEPRFESFEACFEVGYWPLVRSLTAMCGNQEMAADCVQDAFVKAYTRWRRIERYDQPLAWVRRVAINKMRDHGRRQTRTTKLLPRIAQTDTYEIAEPAALDVTAVLAELPRQQRIAAALFYVEELSVAEIADSMKISAGAVKYHLHAARERLRDTLESSLGNQP